MGTSETKRGRYALQCFSLLSSFRISYVVKGVDSITMNYEKILSTSTNKMMPEDLPSRSLSFFSKIASLSWVAGVMMVKV